MAMECAWQPLRVGHNRATTLILKAHNPRWLVLSWHAAGHHRPDMPKNVQH